MPLIKNGRPLKRWRYVGIYGKDVQLCAGVVHVCGLSQTFWAVWDREARRFYEHTSMSPRLRVKLPDGAVRVRSREVEIDLRLEDAGEPIELTSPHGDGEIWTRKTPLYAVGTVRIGGRATPVRGFGLSDDSAGYHARRTDWEWSAGVGLSDGGELVCWNLVRGIHDAGEVTENTVWVAGTPQRVGRTTFGGHLDRLTTRDGVDLRFTAEAVRSRSDGLKPLIWSDYTQPFGLFSGTLPGSIGLQQGYGVMERHSARW